MLMRHIAVTTVLACVATLPAVTSASAAGDQLTPVPSAGHAPFTVGGTGGTVWMRFQDHLRRVTLSGTVTDFPLPVGADVNPEPPVTASDGSVWTLADNNHEVWRIDADDPTSTLGLVIDLGSATARSLVPAGGARVWAAFDDPGADNLALLDVDGVTDTFDAGNLGNFLPTAGAADGSLWFGNLSPFGDGGTTITRVGVDGSTSQVELEAGPGPVSEDVTSMAFDGAGTLWYTTYNEQVVTVDSASGGGIGRYAGGESDWWPRPDAPPIGDGIGGTPPPRGALPIGMQAGQDGWMYFGERSARGRSSLSRISPSLRVQYVEFRDFADPKLRGDAVWFRGGPGFGRGFLSQLFKVGVEPRRVSLRHKTSPEKLFGKVRSRNSGCQRATLRVYRADGGHRVLVRKGRSKPDGTFSLRLRRPEPGRYWVKALRGPIPGGVTTCGAEHSRRRAVR